MTILEDFLPLSQLSLFKKICKHFKGRTLVSKGNFILVRSDAPILLVAHLDTVHSQPVRLICAEDNGNILSSPQGIGGDDRCGCFALFKIYEQSPIKPWLLFTCDEEIGGIGAQKFCLALTQGRLPAELFSLKCIVEIDRRGSDDAVFYDCFNPDFEHYITGKGFHSAFGSFSDISLIAPALGIAAVNLSAGYYNPHRSNEYIVRSELEHTIQRGIEIVADSTRNAFPHYPYETDFDSLWDQEDFDFPRDLPLQFHEIYHELRYLYSATQLEEIRTHFGNHILWQLYREEFGYPYFDS